MSNGNSKLPPNSGMSDERWLSKDERAQSWEAPNGTWQRMLCDHAEAADELIAELAACLRTHVAFKLIRKGEEG